MPRPSLSFHTFAPVLAAVFAFGAIVLVVISRPQAPPRFAGLTVIEGSLKAHSSGITGTSLRIATRTGELTIDAGTCASTVSGLKTGDAIAAWTDTRGRAWRIMAIGRPPCTFLQATTADEASRHRRRIAAVVLAVAGTLCLVVTLLGRRRVRLIDEGSAA